MQIYYVTVETRATSRVTVAAKSEADARADAQMIAGPGGRCIDVVPASYTMEAQAHEALAHLLAQDWLALNNKAASIYDWLAHAADHPSKRDKINAKLAMAGLRMLANCDVVVGSPRTIPALKRWFAATPWDEAGLFAALATLPGARREGPRYFQGVQSRVIRLPAAVVLPCDEVAA